MTFVILTRGIDLSVGSLVALTGLAAAIVAKGGLESRFAVGVGAEAHSSGWFTALLVALAVGTVAGWLQGFAITRLNVPPFVVTLGGMSAFRGAALLTPGCRGARRRADGPPPEPRTTSACRAGGPRSRTPPARRARRGRA